MSAAVGDDIESICSKCGDVWHVVVAKVGDKIAKVICKQCNGTHRYKPPGGAPAAKSGESAPRRRTAGGGAAAPAPAAETSRVAPDLTRPVRMYRPLELFTVGERIKHPTFGDGIVEAVPAPGKMEVYFPSGRRVLAQGKTASTLERPKTGDGGPGVG